MAVLDERLLEQLSTLIGGDQSTLHELIETFLEEGQEIVSEMQLALTEKQIDVLRRGAHSLKSSAQDFGAVELSELNATLESQCKNGWPDNAEQQTKEIASKFSEASAELTRYMSR